MLFVISLLITYCFDSLNHITRYACLVGNSHRTKIVVGGARTKYFCRLSRRFFFHFSIFVCLHEVSAARWITFFAFISAESAKCRTMWNEIKRKKRMKKKTFVCDLSKLLKRHQTLDRKRKATSAKTKKKNGTKESPKLMRYNQGAIRWFFLCLRRARHSAWRKIRCGDVK